MIDAFGQRLIRVIAPIWVPMLLIIGLASALNASLDNADWVAQDVRIIRALNIALGIGWLLSYSRLPGWVVFGYSLFFSGFASLQLTANLIHPPWEMINVGFWPWVYEMNLRFFMFVLRVRGWIGAIQSGENVNDTGLFIFTLTFLMWIAAIWLFWFMLRKRLVLIGLLPIGFLMAVNTNLARQPLIYFSLFLFFAILLIVRETYYRQHIDWERRRVDFPEQLGIDWGFGAIIITLATLGIAQLGPLLGTPQGRQAISKWLEQANRRTAETAEQIFSGVNTPLAPPQGGIPVVRIQTPELHEIGSRLPQGSETVMWVSTSDPPPLQHQFNIPIPDMNIKGHYWRSTVYTSYDGRGWDPAPLSDEILKSNINQATTGEEAPAGRYFLRQTYEFTALYDGPLFAVNEPVLPGTSSQLRRTIPDNSLLLAGKAENYTVISAATRVSGNELAAAPTIYPDEIRQAYLQLPQALPERIRILSDRLTSDAADPFHKALFIQNYLRLNYTYQLDVSPAPAGRDVVDYFLFDQPEGFCSHYASAMVILLRIQGIPSRVATGYSTGTWDISRSAYRVLVSAAHAWVEVYFPGYGWVEFEPTSSLAPFTYNEVSDLGPGPSMPATVPTAPVHRASPLPMVFLLVTVILLSLIPVWLLRFFSTQKGDPARQVNHLYQQIRLALNLAGIDSAPHLTPFEFLIEARPKLTQYDRIWQALKRTTDLYQQSIYSPRSPSITDVKIANDYWQLALKEWVIIWIRDRWNRRKRRSNTA